MVVAAEGSRYLLRPSQIREAVHAEQGWRHRQHGRHEGSRGDLGERPHDDHVVDRGDRAGCPRLGPVPDLVVDDEQTERLAARLAELVLVDLPEELRLIELDRAGHVALQFPPTGCQEPDLKRPVGREAADEPGEAAPGAFEPLKARLMQHRVELGREQAIDGQEVPVDQSAQALRVPAQRRRLGAEPKAQRARVGG